MIDQAEVLLLIDRHDIRHLTGAREGILWLAVTEVGSFPASRHMLVEEVRELVPDCEILLPTDSSTEVSHLERFAMTRITRRGLSEVVANCRTTLRRWCSNEPAGC